MCWIDLIYGLEDDCANVTVCEFLIIRWFYDCVNDSFIYSVVCFCYLECWLNVEPYRLVPVISFTFVLVASK